MTDWKLMKLESIIEIIKESHAPSMDKSLAYIGLEHIEEQKLRISSIGNSTEVKSSKYKFKSGDILFGKLRPYFRKVVQPSFDGICSTDIWVCRAIDNTMVQQYLFYFLANKEFVDTANVAESGTRMPRADWKYLRETEWWVPPIHEQKAISSILSSLDDKIDLLHRNNKTLEAMSETIFRQWFVEETETWRYIYICDLFEVRDGTHDSPKQKQVGKPLLTSKHILDGRLDIDNAYLISEDDFINVNKRSKVDTYDILFSMIGTIGLTYMEQSTEIKYAIKNIGLFKTSQNVRWAYYTYLWLKSSLGKGFIHEHRSGSTQEYISLGSLRSIRFKEPTMDMLDRFNKIVQSMFNKIACNSAQIRTLESLRESLLPKLMSGEIRVKL